MGAALGALLYAVAREVISLADWDPRWFQAFLGVLLLVALLANGVVRRRLRAVPTAVITWFISQQASVERGILPTRRQVEQLAEQVDAWVAPGGFFD